ncbi:putative glucosylceramidase 4 [Apis mellifera]|uniref:Glucosylceramidase n=1 Tax=Apis mellifera TaxID=7460 RepID=A0A7M7R5K0_APIME|nr:putative glucosylceramidase 4 [Apis mellifera]|eukprot:XP_393208.1 putative glucosylceramidase 4 [Apis mellifera]
MNTKHWAKLLFLISFFFRKSIANDCAPYRVDNEIIACVCNATYCDGIPDNIPEVPTEGNSYWYVSNKQGLRMNVSEVKFDRCENFVADTTITVDSKKKYQKIIGFGGAFTDATGINIAKLSRATQEQLIRAYYDPKKGSRYTLGRIPIGSTDFSTRIYTYDDAPGDKLLKNFSLAPEDYNYKIPYVKLAVELNPEVLLFAAAWTAPLWMKQFDNNITYLKEEHYETYVNYLIKFLDKYERNGVNIWGITPSNEPLLGFMIDNPNISMTWIPKTQANWIANYFGPILASSPFNKTLLLTYDDNRIKAIEYVKAAIEIGGKYIAGIGIHWYKDSTYPATIIDRIHEKYPDKFILMTEASIFNPIWNCSSKLKSEAWQRGEKYILSIIDYMNHWSVGWVDWNMVLDKTGGPTVVNNNLDAPIIVNPETDEFYKQPLYYAIKHVSRFVDRDSFRISIIDNNSINSTAFLTPSGETVVVLYNGATSTKHIILKDLQKDSKLCLELSPQSMNTLKYK